MQILLIAGTVMSESRRNPHFLVYFLPAGRSL